VEFFVFVGASTCRVAGAPGIRSPIEILLSVLTKRKSNWGTGHVMTEIPGAPTNKKYQGQTLIFF
jgi:hypothetical protein